MANKKISDLTAVTSVTSSYLLPLVDVDASETKKATFSQVLEYVTGSTINQLTASNLSGSDAKFTSLSASLVTGSDAKFTSLSGNIDWSYVQSTPTTLAGYGITDAALAADAAEVGDDNTFTGVNTFSGHYITGSITGSDAKFYSISASSITANEYNVVTITKTTLSQDGSTKFGDTSGDTHQFTGSIYAGVVSGTTANFTTLNGNLDWSNVQSTPTTLAGYGITDAVTLDTDQTITGRKTFTTHYITASLTGSDAKLSQLSASYITGSAVTIQTLTSSFDIAIGSEFNDGGTDIEIFKIGTGPDGQYSTAIGRESISQNSAGYSNVAVGFRTLKNNEGGHWNVAVGVGSLQENTDGADNTSVGMRAMYSNKQGNENVAIGVFALHDNTSGSFNTAIGSHTLRNIEGPQDDTKSNTAVGAYAMFSHLTGSWNTAVGVEALYANTYGINNTSLGAFCMENNTIGFDNTAIGSLSSWNNVEGSYNVSVGRESLYKNLNGTHNVAVGSYAIRGSGSNVSYSRNIGVGPVTLYNLNTGYANSAIGNAALYNLREGEYNVAIGQWAGLNLLTGSRNVFIGENAGIGETHLENTVIIRTNEERIRIDSDGVTDIKGPLVADVHISGTVASPIIVTSYTLSSADRGKTLLFSSSATQYITCSSGLDVGYNATFIQMGSGQLILSSMQSSLFSEDFSSQTNGAKVDTAELISNLNTYVQQRVLDVPGKKYAVLDSYSSGTNNTPYLQTKQKYSGNISINYTVLKNLSSAKYDTSGLNLESPEANEDLVLEYSTDGTSWTTLKTIMTGSNVKTSGTLEQTYEDEIVLETASYIRFRELPDGGAANDHYAITDINVLSGVELLNRQSHTGSAGQYAAVSVIVIDTDKIIIAGDTV